MSEYSEKEFEIDNSSRGFKDFINLVRNDPYPIFIIIVSSLIISIIFALHYKDIYKSTTSLKISKPKGGVLDASLSPELQGLTDDRFIQTEIEIMKSSNVRQNVAEVLLDTLKSKGKLDSFLYSTNSSFLSRDETKKLSIDDVVRNLRSAVIIEQRSGMNIVDISVESLSPDNAALIANIYANVYKRFNLELNRDQLTMVKDFLLTHVQEKQNELKESESTLSQFQAKNGVISLDDQSKTLISQLANSVAQRDGAKIELGATEKVLAQLTDELNQQNPKVAAYIENQASQSYVLGLQEEIAKLQIQKDLVSIHSSGKEYNQQITKQYDDQIDVLKKKLQEKTNIIKQALFASNPDAIKDLTIKILDAKVKEKGLTSQLNQLNEIVRKYESEFNKLPLTTINYAQLLRIRESSEKLFSLLEEKYQEALINEQSQPGNIFIFDQAVRSATPSKPNRSLIIFTGLILGIIAGFGYLFIKDYFDDRIKSPDELERRNINILAWIPVIESMGVNGNGGGEFIVAEKPDAMPSEAFKALRTRVQFSKVGKNVLKTILVTSAAPGEGKTVVSVNLAGAFAQDGKKTLLIDADLRKPRIHNMFNKLKSPGFTDYFFENAALNDIITPTQLENLSIVSTGTLPPNPSELLGSKRMIDFLREMREKYDIVILDSAPIIAVTDTEILSRLVDAAMIIVSTDSTQLNLVEKAVHLIKNDQSLFLGTVLNKFSYKAGYGSYYKYYYYYSGKKKNKEQFFKNADRV
ncbi:MAG: polysaccharide biosynthesis tyrosine autokinase [Ignavibacteriaceae bacterium]|nr:polysaccharide biosynthesis tyrosine autokinase [Ignavibacteriaceae bacterium]